MLRTPSTAGQPRSHAGPASRLCALTVRTRRLTPASPPSPMPLVGRLELLHPRLLPLLLLLLVLHDHLYALAASLGEFESPFFTGASR